MITASGASDTGSGILGFILIVAGIGLYWLPAIIAGARHVPNTGSVVIIDLFLGWTLVGWVVALAMACRSQPAPGAYFTGTPAQLLRGPAAPLPPPTHRNAWHDAAGRPVSTAYVVPKGEPIYDAAGTVVATGCGRSAAPPPGYK